MGRIKTVFGRHWVMLLDRVGDRYLAIEVQKRKNLDFTWAREPHAGFQDAIAM